MFEKGTGRYQYHDQTPQPDPALTCYLPALTVLTSVAVAANTQRNCNSLLLYIQLHMPFSRKHDRRAPRRRRQKHRAVVEHPLMWDGEDLDRLHDCRILNNHLQSKRDPSRPHQEPTERFSRSGRVQREAGEPSYSDADADRPRVGCG